MSGEEPLPEEQLVGGYLSATVRVGDTVRRQTGRWTAAVHELLRHLEAVDFGAPRVLGVDAQGREVLTYIEGRTVGEPPWPSWVWADDLLRETGRRLRQYHDAVASFQPPEDAQWRFARGRPGPGEVVCHNDVAPQNMVFRDGRIVALLDWDWAEPAPPEWDLAHAAWLGVPLMTPEACAHHGLTDASIDLQARRLELLCDAYGLHDGVDIVDVVVRRIQSSVERIRDLKDADPSLANLEPFVPGMQRTLDYVLRHRGVLG